MTPAGTAAKDPDFTGKIILGCDEDWYRILGVLYALTGEEFSGEFEPALPQAASRRQPG
jgi:hypothetical protein